MDSANDRPGDERAGHGDGGRDGGGIGAAPGAARRRSATARGSSTRGSRPRAGYDAGLALAEICMGGLGDIAYTPAQIGAQSWPGSLVTTDHPAVSCMASQYAGWAISVDKFFAMGSGPLRAHARVEKELFEKLGYEEEASARRAGARGTGPARPTRWRRG